MERKIKLQITGMEKKYKNGDGVENINIDVYEGEFVTMLGPSGCGKSTILRTLGGFLDIDKGDVLIDGQSVKNLPPEKRPTAMVFQSYNLWPHMTVYENLAFGLEIKKVPKNKIRSEIERGLKLVNMSGYEKKYPGQLSGGQQQRIAIARALLLKPSVLLLDEPFSALDAKIRAQMREELKKIQEELNITVVFVTHDQEEALTMSDRIVVMNKGVIEQDDNPDNIYHYPSTKFVAKFIGESNFFDTETETLALRPEKLNLCEEAESEDKAAAHPEPAFYGTVVDVVFYGTIDKVFVRLDNSNQTVVAYQYFDDVKRWTPDERVGIWWYERDEVKVQR